MKLYNRPIFFRLNNVKDDPCFNGVESEVVRNSGPDRGAFEAVVGRSLEVAGPSLNLTTFTRTTGTNTAKLFGYY